mmetsp:Transcript_23522/g.59116  ORF Transcript_23522/g.59116 Transcript_23522/m.59116 type:complete len:498 (+) Transcript_23522:326-1819(+)
MQQEEGGALVEPLPRGQLQQRGGLHVVADLFQVPGGEVHGLRGRLVPRIVRDPKVEQVRAGVIRLLAGGLAHLRRKVLLEHHVVLLQLRQQLALQEGDAHAAEQAEQIDLQQLHADVAPAGLQPEAVHRVRRDVEHGRPFAHRLAVRHELQVMPDIVPQACVQERGVQAKHRSVAVVHCRAVVHQGGSLRRWVAAVMAGHQPIHHKVQAATLAASRLVHHLARLKCQQLAGPPHSKEDLPGQVAEAGQLLQRSHHAGRFPIWAAVLQQPLPHADGGHQDAGVHFVDHAGALHFMHKVLHAREDGYRGTEGLDRAEAQRGLHLAVAQESLRVRHLTRHFSLDLACVLHGMQPTALRANPQRQQALDARLDGQQLVEAEPFQEESAQRAQKDVIRLAHQVRLPLGGVAYSRCEAGERADRQWDGAARDQHLPPHQLEDAQRLVFVLDAGVSRMVQDAQALVGQQPLRALGVEVALHAAQQSHTRLLQRLVIQLWHHRVC